MSQLVITREDAEKIAIICSVTVESLLQFDGFYIYGSEGDPKVSPTGRTKAGGKSWAPTATELSGDFSDFSRWLQGNAYGPLGRSALFDELATAKFEDKTRPDVAFSEHHARRLQMEEDRARAWEKLRTKNPILSYPPGMTAAEIRGRALDELLEDEVHHSHKGEGKNLLPGVLSNSPMGINISASQFYDEYMLSPVPKAPEPAYRGMDKKGYGNKRQRRNKR